ncbi:MAG: L-aspartate oxidase [Nanoarchaeota archaeon]|nr:L-aspartate oxidase [Nanoarchaeota archaeon]MBU1704953.1 L-aspartate oxidase [Nanoarchaeota archaeon]
MEQINTEYLIIGSGLAGLRAAIELSRAGKRPTIVTKSKIEDANTFYAQGGAAAVDPARVETGNDDYQSHVDNTLTAGAGLCDPAVVDTFVKRAFPDAIKFLIDAGVDFTRNDGSYPYHLGQEGGHDHPRVFCVGDYTGQAIEETLAEIVRQDPNITVLENHTAINLITHNQFADFESDIDRCLGAYVLDRETGKVRTFSADTTILATGGVGRAFLYTSNPENATGDGIAMAYRAGAVIANMEFFQFHPTVLYEANPENPSERRFLLTEAFRGEETGAILTLTRDSLEDFVLRYDPRGSHATRDIVARAIDTEIKKRGIQHVWLNATPAATGKSPEYIKAHFPKIYAHCLSRGIDITKEPMPAIPAAHYTCGGIIVDTFGRTTLNGLYAIGETSYTGLMGANRLASNSLPEAALYGKLAVEHALDNSVQHGERLRPWQYGNIDKAADQATLNQFWDNTRRTMMTLCGIDRNEERLRGCLGALDGFDTTVDDIYQDFHPTHEIIELRNLLLVSKLITDSALSRKESRGGHFRSDFPDPDDRYNFPTLTHRDVGIYRLR